ncbi:MAG: heat-inducible transcriptional repressor HrcA [Oscillospiraceae bacterium]|nr:heat-inducible transcriptional repressor HrcA [Oscillospiraceae bacterium]
MDKRKLKILSAVVEKHIEAGEPVGSKLVSQMMDVSLSSATIRNEMALLEEEGYLHQPHASAGRIPTVKGYHEYIERVMRPVQLSEEEKQLLDNMLVKDEVTAGALVENAVTALAELTGYAVVRLENVPEFTVIAKVEVVPAGYRLYALLIITSGGEVRNKVCRTQIDLTEEQITVFTEKINKTLSGVKVHDLDANMLKNLAAALGGYVFALAPLLYSIAEISGEMNRHGVDIKGGNKLFDDPDIDSQELLRLFAKKDVLASVLESALDGVNVVFGKEEDEFLVTNSSLILTKYKEGEASNPFGILGPMRIDYAKIIPYIDYFAENITRSIEDMTLEER